MVPLILPPISSAVPSARFCALLMCRSPFVDLSSNPRAVAKSAQVSGSLEAIRPSRENAPPSGTETLFEARDRLAQPARVFQARIAGLFSCAALRELREL